ncbi:hypothetical protein CHISP_2888 [Chitinispirillum alkaliphilum]|nr:hypothetical protein CHISP_2888 [Chitinispirillum alkaliphilum]
MDTMWEKIKKNLKDGAAMSMEKIEEYTKIGKLKVEEMSAKRKIERNYLDAGERVYELLEEGKDSGIGDDLVIKKCVENVNSLKEEIAEIAQKIEEVSEYQKSEDQEEEDEVNAV